MNLAELYLAMGTGMTGSKHVRWLDEAVIEMNRELDQVTIESSRWKKKAKKATIERQELARRLDWQYKCWLADAERCDKWAQENDKLEERIHNLEEELKAVGVLDEWWENHQPRCAGCQEDNPEEEECYKGVGRPMGSSRKEFGCTRGRQ